MPLTRPLVGSIAVGRNTEVERFSAVAGAASEIAAIANSSVRMDVLISRSPH
jgi:hypothetical protein